MTRVAQFNVSDEAHHACSVMLTFRAGKRRDAAKARASSCPLLEPDRCFIGTGDRRDWPLSASHPCRPMDAAVQPASGLFHRWTCAGCQPISCEALCRICNKCKRSLDAVVSGLYVIWLTAIQIGSVDRHGTWRAETL